MLKILTLTGSPVKGGSTDILLERIVDGIGQSTSEPINNEIIRLNDYSYLPCQSCGKSPEPDFCFFNDEIYPVYQQFLDCDIVLFGSPVYFDSVSAQAKLFIDRCNCLRPMDFSEEAEHQFKTLISKKRLGAMVLVGGERQEYEAARKVIAGFFIWTEVINGGIVVYAGSSNRAGSVADNAEKMKEAFDLGRKLSSRFMIDNI
jgi:multimeric flavodoxin WrbA